MLGVALPLAEETDGAELMGLRVGLSHSIQNKELSHPKKKMDIKVDYAQVLAGPASGPSPEFLAPAV